MAEDLVSLSFGLQSLQEESLGNPEICVAVLDGPVDLSHPCFQGADLRRVATLVNDPAGTGPVHGTHVTSVCRYLFVFTSLVVNATRSLCCAGPR